VTAQLELVAPTVRVQGLPVKLPLADPFEKVTVPPGPELVPESISDTTAVHVVEWLICTGFGTQLTCVVVERVVTVTLEPVPSLLPACTGSLGE
jgi:hypothetical protein